MKSNALRFLFAVMAIISFFGSGALSEAAPATVTKAEFAKLSDEAKTEILEFYGTLPKNMTALEYVSRDKVPAKYAEQVEQAIAEIESEMSFEVDTDPEGAGTVSVGPVRYSFRLVTIKSSGELVGLAVDVRQDGGYKDPDTVGDEPTWHYETREEADADGVDTKADVVWSGSAIFEVTDSAAGVGSKLRAIELDSMLEWAGW